MEKTTIKKKKYFIPCVCFFFLFFAGRAQNIDATIAEYAEKFTQERMYLHFDKASYSPGETIWFKAYMMEDILPALKSKNIYVDWTDEKGKLYLHSVYPVVDAGANGQFDIPGDFAGKSLHVRAYTRWMLNFDSSFLYDKEIRILSKTSSPAGTKPAIVASLQFFPEGGDAIAGINNRIAFKANDQWGRPVKIKGTVTDNKGKTISNLIAEHDGMGSFTLTPEAGAVYTAKWKDEKGGDHVTTLPEIKKDGLALQVSSAPGNKKVLAVNCTVNAAQALGELNIIGTMYQNEVFKIKINAVPGGIQKSIPVESLPSGILTITVFDKQWNAIAERITYVNNGEYLFQPEMEVKHWGLSKRARNEVQITIPDSIVANLSVAVTDIGIDADSSGSIISHLLLTSELKGRVFNPAYYFSNNSDSVSRHLDLVMLTHGWRRFKWEDVVKGKVPDIKYPRDTTYLSLSGRVIGALPSQLNDAGEIIIFAKTKDTSSASRMIMIPVLPNGTFNDPEQVFSDTLHVYYMFQNKKELNGAEVRFMENRLPPRSNSAVSSMIPYNLLNDTSGNARHNFLAAEAKRIRDMVEGKELEAVIVRAKTRSPIQVLDDKYTSGFFKGGDGYQFDLVNDKLAGAALNIFSYLQGKVAGLQITNVTSTGTPGITWRGATPSFFLNEVPTDASMISSINVNDVAYIKVFRPPFFGGAGGGAGGGIAIYTRKGGDEQKTPGKGLSNSVISGYSPMKQFYSPNYASFDKRNEEKDFRTTLYWNPNISLSPQKKQAVLTFYNNDVSDYFRVIIEGMTSDGRLAHVEQIME